MPYSLLKDQPANFFFFVAFLLASAMQRFTPMDPKEVDMVIYHANCADGAAGAVCALLRGGGKVHLHPGKHVNVKDDPDALEVAQGKCLLLVDFVYEREFLLRLKQVTKKIYVLDHHRSAMEQLQDLEFCLFDMNRSGARMAWDYFFAGCEPPRFIKFIEDRDLWRWAVPGSREFTTAFYNTIASEPINFVQFFQLGADGVWRDNDLLVDKFLQDGKLIVEYVESVVQKTASGTRMIQFKSANDKSIVMVNETHYGVIECCSLFNPP